MENISFNNKSIYDFYKESNSKHLTETAIIYNGKEITHQQLLDMADDCAKSLLAMGVKKNDSVAVWLLNTPELVGLFLGISKIGAMAEFIDPRVTAEQIRKELKITDSKLFISTTIYQFDKLIETIIKETSIENVISVSPAEQFGFLGRLLISITDSIKEIQKNNMENSSGMFGNFVDFNTDLIKRKIKRKILINLKNAFSKNKGVNYISWSKFKKLGEKLSLDKESSHEGGILIKTSGTSKGMKAGYGKLIKLTQQNAIALAYQHQMLHKELNIERGDTVMSFAPFSLAYGCLDATIMPLSMGVKLILLPDFDPKKMAEYVLKYKPNHLLTCPAYIEEMKSSPLINDDTDLSFIKTIVAGGEKYELSKIKETNEFLHNHRVLKNVEVTVGYGKNELSSAATYTLKSPEKTTEKFKSTGLGGNYIGDPLPGNIIIIVDSNNTILPEKTIGRIAISGPTVMEGYYMNPELNQQAFFEKNSRIFHDTEDLGYYIENVGFWCKGREGRQLYDNTGKKIDYDSLEEFVAEIEEVDHCMVVQSKTDKKLVLYLSLKKQYENQKDEIKLKIYEMIFVAFKEEKSLLPEYITILDIFPITENAKGCWVELENMDLNDNDRVGNIGFSKSLHLKDYSF